MSKYFLASVGFNSTVRYKLGYAVERTVASKKTFLIDSFISIYWFKFDKIIKKAAEIHIAEQQTIKKNNYNLSYDF